MPKTALQTLPDRLQQTKVGLALNIEGLASIIDEATEALRRYERDYVALIRNTNEARKDLIRAFEISSNEITSLMAEVAGLRGTIRGAADRMSTLAGLGVADTVQTDCKKHVAKLLNEGIAACRRSLSTSQGEQ